jgi:Holliday junction resolvasome RuvABC endonuclease subunit
MEPDVVLGLDLTTCMGWAAFDLDIQLVGSGAWNLGQPTDAHDGDRWIACRGQLGRLLATYHGRICAIGFERPSTVQWNTARIAFGQAAIIELDAAKLSIPTATISPATLKKVVAGHGHASKQEVQDAVVLRTGALTMPGGTTKLAEKLRSDEADARAIAIAMLSIYTIADLRGRVLMKRPPEPKPSRSKRAS